MRAGCAILLIPFVAGAVTLGGCASSSFPPPEPPVAPDPPPSPVVREADDHADELPRSVRRLVAEQRARLDDCASLVQNLDDPLGRARARGEIDAVAGALADVERRLDAWRGDSDDLDALVDELRRNETRVSLLRDALRGATQ